MSAQRRTSLLAGSCTHYVYRLFDRAGRLLYIGATYSVPLRMENHRYSTPWFADVARVESESYPTRREAFAAEAAAIQAEVPLRNVRRRPGRAIAEMTR